MPSASMAWAAFCCVVLALAHRVSADAKNGWRIEANNKADAMGKSSTVPNAATLDMWWEDFKATYQRNYNAAEEALAKAAFRLNMLENLRINRDASLPYWTSGNQFSDISFSTLKDRMLMKFNPLTTGGPNGRKLAQAETVTGGARRSLLQTNNITFVDWRTTGKVTAVKNQGPCGSCWAFAATGAIESAYLISKDLTASTSGLDLSEQQMVSCANSAAGYWSGGCDGGYSDGAMLYVRDFNQTKESIYPYTSGATNVTGTCSSVIGTSAGQAVQSSPGDLVYYTAGDESALRAAVDIQPVVVYFDVQGSFQGYAGGIYKPTDCTGTSINHAMLAVGYYWDPNNVSASYWIVKNSWASWWGESGYIRVHMNGSSNGVCNMYQFAVAPSLSFAQSLAAPPQSPPPSPSPPRSPPPPPKGGKNPKGL